MSRGQSIRQTLIQFSYTKIGCKYSDEINVNFFLFVFEDFAQKEIDVEELNVG